MMWLWLSAVVVLLGAQLNAESQNHDTAAGVPIVCSSSATRSGYAGPPTTVPDAGGYRAVASPCECIG
jgi:hypothetical protein